MTPDPTQLWIHHCGAAENILGPGRRLVIWTSGCPLGCKGCIEEARWPLESGYAYAPADFYASIEPLLGNIDGVTFSGGEPLYQAKAMAALMDRLPSDLDKMLFTGYSLHELSRTQWEVGKQMDLVVVGRFIEVLHGNHLWRGSSNQQLISPSGKYPTEQLDAWMQEPSAGLQIHTESGVMHFYGIPVPGALDHFFNTMQEQSITIEEAIK